MSSKTLAPISANSLKKVCSLQSDNFSTVDFWIITDGYNVTICKQKHGKPAENDLSIPVGDFNKLIEWYTKKQQTHD